MIGISFWEEALFLRVFTGKASERGITMGNIREINGLYASAKVFTTNENDIHQYAIAQIQMLCDNETFVVINRQCKE